jgi:hypothetical protein
MTSLIILVMPFVNTNIFSNAIAQAYSEKYRSYYYDLTDDYTYECQKGPFEGFFVSSPEFWNLNVPDSDTDGDGINDNVDNCPLVANTNQTDTDNDGIGNVFDPTSSNPGVEPLAFSDLGYDTGDIKSGWEWGKSQAADIIPPSINLQTVDKTSITPPSPDPDGNKILNTTVFPGDLAIDSEGNHQVDNNASRAEVFHNEPFQSGTENPLEDRYYEDDDVDNDADNVDDEMWFHWYTLFPSESVLPIIKDKFHVWTQFHQLLDQTKCPTPTRNISCSAVPILFNLRDFKNDNPDRGPLLQFLIIDKNNETSNTSFFETLWTDPEPLQREKWYEFLLHVNWSKCNNFTSQGTCTNHGGGFVELWVKKPGVTIAENVIPKKTHYTTDVDGIVYAKQGLYTCNSVTNPGGCKSLGGSKTIYHDGMEVAKCPSTHPYYHPNTKQCFTTEPYL